MSAIARRNLEQAAQLVAGLVEMGVRHCVHSPGSRSTPLTLACARHPGLRVWVQLDERCGGFFALGLARASGAPVLLLATSGSAPAHWYPAVLEADRDRVPLILVSADRPAELQGWGANQTTDQAALFGTRVRAFHGVPAPSAEEAPRWLHALGRRVAAEARGPRPGPVHVNMAFREPLVAADSTPPGAGAPAWQDLSDARSEPGPRWENRATAPGPADVARMAGALEGRPGLLICGRGPMDSAFAAALTRLADHLQAPILADPLSGLRFGTHAKDRICAHYDAYLRAPEFAHRQAPDWVLRFGGMPVSKTLLDYLDRHGQAVSMLVDPAGEWRDPLHRSADVLRADPESLCRALLEAAPAPAPAAWGHAFRAAEQTVAGLAAAGAFPPELPPEARVVASILEVLPADGALFCGSSLPIRQIDTWSGTGDRVLFLHGNRGVSGIDGHVSTTLGIAAGSGRPTVGLLGDLACCHDLGGLAMARTVPATLVILNNGGGGIFEYLPQAELPEFERYWLTPTEVEFAAVARGFGLSHVRITDPGALPAVLRQAIESTHTTLIEVMIGRRESTAAHRRYWRTVTEHMARATDAGPEQRPGSPPRPGV